MRAGSKSVSYYRKTCLHCTTDVDMKSMVLFNCFISVIFPCPGKRTFDPVRYSLHAEGVQGFINNITYLTKEMSGTD